jgi:electron transfer flavoprotein beta subunit
MKIAVCIKQVPGTNEVRMDPVTHTIRRDARQAVTNPFDSYALELAVQIKESRDNVTVTALSMGIPATGRLLRDAVSRGAARAARLTDRAFAGADTLATSYTLAAGIKKLGGFDLILCGKMAVDGDTAQIGPELAEHLNIAHVTEVLELTELDETELVCRRAVDGGVQTLSVRLPALLTVAKDINMPRMPSIAGVRRGIAAPVEILDAKALGADPGRIGLSGSPTQVVRTWVMQRSEQARPIEGAAPQQAAQLANLIGEAL